MAETILVIAEQREGRLNRVSLETVAAAQALAKQTGWAVEAAVVGGEGIGAAAGNNAGAPSPAAELARCAVTKISAIEGAALEPYTPDGFVSALKAFIESARPRLVLLPHTYQVRDFAPRLAAVCGAALVSDCVGCGYENGKLIFTRPMFQGKFAADLSPAGDGPYLTQAGIIVSVGRGIKEQKNIAIAQALAEAMGGELAASRPICDAGWLPMERQVGSSGQTVNPNLYLALGISGAIQHLVGMKGSRNIIAVNKDAEAPIFEIADVAVVGDLFEIVPALTEEVKKAKS